MEFETITRYIDSLYAKKAFLRRENYTARMVLKEFIPTVDDETAQLLRLIIAAAKPRNILEIGTSVGYSTVSMALMAEEYGGHITTIEFDVKSADQAEESFLKAGVSPFITVMRGDAREILPALSGPYDLIFQDVDKRLYPLLLGDCVRLLPKGGLLLADDALFPVLGLDEKWRDQVKPVDEYNEHVMADSRLTSILLPVGDGIMVSLKK